MGRVSEQATEDQQQPADAVDPATADPATAEVVAEDRIEEAEQSGRVATDTAEPGFVRFDCIDPQPADAGGRVGPARGRGR